ncbi:flagellar brake protein [Bacillus kwashiorkori]|uniref:flagellar brake protein n=1 Tax=Bacillus kwashiorkori TaxID=1522318 RepID=UPI000784E44E|nr:flagellar brake domain-containing protein [Bacillus kwashiorkori]
MLEIGDQVKIEALINNKYEIYQSKVMDLQDDLIFIEYPVHLETNRTAFLLDETSIKVSFIRNDDAFEFPSKVVGRSKENIPLIKISRPTEQQMKRIQRRKFVRIHRGVDVAVHPLFNEFTPFTTITDDISAGGASIIVSNKIPIKKGQQLQAMFVLPMHSGQYHYNLFKCKIVRIMELNTTKNIVSLQFLDKTSQQEQQLIRFCFESQVAWKQKELGL